MKILAIAKPDASGNQNLICILKEVEADKITGSAGKPHAPHRYKAGMDLVIGKIYNRIKYFNENFDAIKAAMAETKVNVQEIEDSLPLET